MDYSNELASSSINSNRNLDWVFLVDWILVLVMSLSIIFYFNRLVGYVITQAIRILTWKRCKIRINIESLKISFLGGRIFVKNMILITPNETVSILKANFTWRYWLTITRESEYAFFDRMKGEEQKSCLENEKLPSRFGLAIEGLEIFIYNRSDAYDSIMELLNKEKNIPDEVFGSKENPDGGLRQRHKENHINSESNNTNSSTSTSISDTSQLEHEQADYIRSLLLRFLPIDLTVKKGAIVVGNDSTTSIIVASYTTAQGSYDIGVSASSLDKYRVNYNFSFNRLQVSLKPNLTYTGPQALNLPRRFTTANTNNISSSSKRHRAWNKLTQHFRKLDVFHLSKKGSRNMDESSQNGWAGLRQYIGDDDPANLDEFDVKEEYAKYSMILDSDAFNITYFYDIPGLIPMLVEPTNPLDGPDIGNSGAPPLIGISINMSQSTVHYGPWAERQRVSLHNMLFPTACRDSKPQQTLVPGELRVYTSCKIIVEIDDESIIRLPTREPSKDKQFIQDQRNKNLGLINRPFGWLELKIDSKSVISSEVMYIPTETGWGNWLSVCLKKPEARSSVNHDIFFRADEHIIDASIGYPLKWNGPALWHYQNVSKNGESFFLREHITLLSDLFSDFASGAPIPYEFFRPFHYSISWRIYNYAIYLNINDSNIINNPLDFNDNTYVSFQGDDFGIQVDIPMDAIYKKSNTITFALDTPFFNLLLDSPPWHTANSFLKSKTVGKSYQFNVDGSYTYYSEVELNASDRIVIKCLGEDVTLKTYGSLVRYMMIIIENYFGDKIHFKTLEEYTEETKALEESLYNRAEHDDQDTITDVPKFLKTENDFDVLFSFCVRNGCIVLPYHLYDCSSHVALNFSSLDIDIRFTNYYMDLQADLSPVRARFVEDCDDDVLFELTKMKENYEPDMFIDGLSIHGHRMFGLPPIEPTYFCKWDFVAGQIGIDSEAKFLSALGTVGNILGFGYSDSENALLIDIPILYDITSVSFICSGISIKINNKVEESSVVLDLDSISFKFNDIANERYSSRVSVEIPSIALKVLPHDESILVAGFDTSLSFTNFCQKRNFEEHKRLQQKHVMAHDAPFHRCGFLLSEENRAGPYADFLDSVKPSFSLPAVSMPLNKQTSDYVYQHIDAGEESDSYTLMSDDSSLNSRSLNHEDTFDNDFYEFLPRSGVSNDNPKRKEKTLNERMPSFCDYNDTDYVPHYEVKPEFEYDSFIVDLAETYAFLSPKSLEILFDTFKNFNNDSIDSLMDDLQLDVISALESFFSEQSTVKNLRFVTPAINMKFGNFEVHSFEEVFSENSKFTDCVDLKILVPSLVFSVEDTVSTVPSLHDTRTLHSLKDFSAAVHIKNVILSMKGPEPSTSPHGLSALFDDLECWYTKHDGQECVTSVNLKTFDIFVNSEKLDWLMLYIINLKEDLGNLADRVKLWSERNDRREVELLYQLSKASSDYRIEHDPSVLTKPAYIIRSSKDHVRANDSWKVVTRLRHVFKSLPPEWHEETNRTIKSQEYSAPESALQDVLEIFSRWRSWEFSDIQNSYIFRHVFKLESREKYEDSNDMKLQLYIESFILRFFSKDSDDDFLCFDYLDSAVYLSGKKEIKILPLKIDSIADLLAVKVELALTSYRSKVSYNLLSLKSAIEKMISPTPSHPADQAAAVKEKKISIQVTLSIESFEQIVHLQKANVVLRGANFSTSYLGIFLGSLKEDFPFTLAANLESFGTEIHHEKKTILSSVLNEGSAVIGSVGNLVSGAKVVDCHAQSFHVKCDSGSDSYVKFLIAVLEDEISFIEKLIPVRETDNASGQGCATVDSPETSPLKLPANMTITIKIEEISWMFILLSPFKVRGSIGSIIFALGMKDQVINVSVSVSDIKHELEVPNKKLIKLQTSGLESNINIEIDDSKILIRPIVKCGITKFLIHQIEDTVFIILSGRKELTAHINDLMAIKERYLSRFILKPTDSPNVIEVATPEGKKKKMIYFDVQFSNEYINASAFMGGTKLSSETKSVSISLKNFISVQSENSQLFTEVGIYGKVSFPTNRISIFDASIASGLSNILDVNLVLKIMNPENELNNRGQSLQVESDFCRVCLNPYTLFRIFTLIDRLCPLFDKFALDAEPTKKVKEDSAPDSAVDNLLNFYAIQILSYNFCIGWIFLPGKTHEYPGIIAGCEKVFIAHEKGLGKFTLMDAYVSVANGPSSSNFFSTSSEKQSLNRAFLPNMQVTFSMYSDTSSRDIHANLSGEELDVKFLSTSMVLVEKTLSSIIFVRDFMAKRPTPVVGKKSPTSEISYAESLGSKFTSIQCHTSFAGGNVLLYRLDAGDGSVTPSMNLHSPAVTVFNSYVHDHHAAKKHTFKMEALTSSSDNTLYPTCVPVIVDIIHSIKTAMKEPNTKKNVVAPVKTANKNSTLNSGFDVGTLLKDTDIQIGVRIERQNLAFSCEPTAKVQALVGIGGMYVRINSCEDSTKLFGVITMDDINASLQHIYSREVSGSFVVHQVVETISVDFSDVTSIYSAGCVSSVTSYINLKQYQDLDLFKDVWVPRDLFEDGSHPFIPAHSNVEPSGKNIATRVREVSSTTAIPWLISFSIIDVSLKVDLGQSLGIFSLCLDRFWAVSRKSVNWDQNLKLGFDNVILSSEGRLSGSLTLKNIKLQSAISWKLRDRTFDIPLVLLSGGVDSLQIKAAFDYHVFLLSNLEDLSLSVYNQRDDVDFARDRLLSCAKYERLEIYFTTFAASTIVDIYNTIIRMFQDSKRSYREVLKDSNTAALDSAEDLSTTAKELGRLKTEIDVRAGETIIQIFPSSLCDSQVLAIHLGEAIADFTQNSIGEGLENKLNLKLNDLTVALSSLKVQFPEELINSCEVSKFVLHSREAKGGTIFVFPSLSVTMNTYQKPHEYVIEYLYQSSFGGKVDVRWNLGSVNFIREMWATHEKAFSSRTVNKFRNDSIISPDVDDIDINAGNSDIDKLIADKIDKVENKSKFTYKPLAKPVIEVPQLKELGNATPPLEWFGLHRSMFPDATHQIVIVGLQKLVHEVETQYSKILGKA